MARWPARRSLRGLTGLLVTIAGCGGVDLPDFNGGSSADSDEPGAPPDAGVPISPHADALQRCEREAIGSRLRAESNAERIELERTRIQCLRRANDDAAMQLHDVHPDPTVLGEALAVHRGFGGAACAMAAVIEVDDETLRSAGCEADIELALGHLIDAHADLGFEQIEVAERRWLYQGCYLELDDNLDAARSEEDMRLSSEAFAACIEESVLGRLQLIADLLVAIDGRLEDDVQVLHDVRPVADRTCAAFHDAAAGAPDAARAAMCAADWLILSRSVLDQYVEP